MYKNWLWLTSTKYEKENTLKEKKSWEKMDFYDVIGSILERKYFTRTGVLNANWCINLIMISLKKNNTDITAGYSRETTLIVLEINKNLLV